jgi:hypothetical protein
LSPDNSKKLKKPKPWKHNQAITTTQLKQMRDEFWDTAPHYGGQKEIWDALRAAAEAELSLAQTIVDSAGIIVSNSDMTICYDERGENSFFVFVFLEQINILTRLFEKAQSIQSHLQETKQKQKNNH